MLFKRQWNIHLTYYDEIKDQLYDTMKDDISRAEDISVEVDDFKEANEALEYQDEVRNGETVKTEPDEFEDEDKKPLEDKVEGWRFNACDVEKVKTEPVDLNFRFGFNFYSVKCINFLTLVLILKCFHVLLKLFLFSVVRLNFNFVNITTINLGVETKRGVHYICDYLCKALSQS